MGIAASYREYTGSGGADVGDEATSYKTELDGVSSVGGSGGTLG